MIAKKTKKQLTEEKFHDHYAAGVKLEDVDVAENFSYSAQENLFALKSFGNLRGKRILDLGCGFGETAVYWAKKGAIVEGVDISSESINLAKKLAKKYNVTKTCNFAQMTAENLKFKSSYFDFAFGNGVLHHVTLEPSAKEIWRVLKKGGHAVFVEPLAYNPVISVYRKIADEVRTPTEKPLTFKEINSLKKIFKHVEHREFELLTLSMFIWFFIVNRVSPNADRYWRKILRVRGTQKKVLKFLIKMDKYILTLVPPLRYLCWDTVITFKK